MRVEHYLTGMWVVLAGTLFWVTGFVSFFWLSVTFAQDWINYIGMVFLIAGILLIVIGGQVIRMSMKGEPMQPTEEGRKMRLFVCSQCGTENPDDAKYCLGCGKKMKRLPPAGA